MENVRTSLRRCVCIVLGLLLFAAVLPVSAFAECAETKTVRAGWYEDAYNITGEHGERSGYGYGYEYEQAAAYTGWSYEYVRNGWANLLEMMGNGEIDLMGGVIRVESAPGKGSRFEVTLEMPIDTEARPAPGARSQPAQEEDISPFCGMKFLCAEDNEINAEILQMLLESKGASCKIYPDGKALVDAFAAAAPGDYDMILMDVQMPVLDGLEAARRIRSGANPLGRTIPILAITANAFLEDRQKSREAGMDEHLSKPVDIRVLEQAVRRFRAAARRADRPEGKG